MMLLPLLFLFLSTLNLLTTGEAGEIKLISPVGTIHSNTINLQISPYQCAFESDRPDRTICFGIQSIDESRSKVHSLCFNETQVTEPHFIAVGNLGNGTFRYRVELSNCSNSGMFHVVTSCANKVLSLKSKTSGMTNDIQTPPLDNARCLEEWGDAIPSLYQMMNVLSAARSTFGQPYTESAFGHGDKMFVEFIMQRHSGFKKIVEFGTWTGITSMFFGMTAALRGGTLVTFDIADQRKKSVRSTWLKEMKFLLADLENPQALDDQAIKAVQQADFLFNDGWHKDVESALYAKFLPIGAGILEHDYSYDHQRPQKDYFLETLGFEPTYEAIGIHLNSCARFWIRTSKFPDDVSIQHVENGDTMRDVEEERVEDEEDKKDKNDEEDVNFIQWAMQYEEGRDLLSRWRTHMHTGVV